MIGRAALGQPWIFREIAHYLATGEHLPSPSVTEIHRILRAHLEDLHEFYGEGLGVRIARKHILWYTKDLAGSAQFRSGVNQIESGAAQLAAVDQYFQHLAMAEQRIVDFEEARAA
jgi:tRNA-dihydrouridine synthase B